MRQAEPAAEWLVHLDDASGETGLAAAAETLSRLGFVVVVASAAMRGSTLPEPTPGEEQAASRHRDPSGYLLRRRIARAVVALGCGQAAERLKIDADSLGKPVFRFPEADLIPEAHLIPEAYLPFDPGLHLGFSARDGMSLVGIARQRIGVDLEGEIAADAIPWNILRPDEAATIKSMPDHEHPQAFVRLWSLKEAFLKASGAVLSVAPEAIRISETLQIDLQDGRAVWRSAAARMLRCEVLMPHCGNHALQSRYTIAVALLSEASQ